MKGSILKLGRPAIHACLAAWLLVTNLLLSVQFVTPARAASLAQTDEVKTATDGTLQLYEVRNETEQANCPYTYNGKLYASSDGGKTWQQRGQQFGGNVVSVAPAYVDARSVYLLVADFPVAFDNKPSYSIYFSADAGLTWEKRYQGGTLLVAGCSTNYYNQLQALPGRNTPVNYIEYRYLTGLGGSSGSSYAVLLSSDGARTFNEVGSDNAPYHRLDYYFTPQGILRYYNHFDPTLGLSTDGGKTWQPLNLPEYKPVLACTSIPCAYNVLGQPPNAPGNFFYYTRLFNIDRKQTKDLAVWYSADYGKSWQKIADGLSDVEFSENAPTTVKGLDLDKNPVTLALPDLDRVQTSPAQPNNVRDGYYFKETSHNLYGYFKAYWDAHGGLAQFGFPKTEPFREYNPADGKVYIVQYFERNRFEYHPENAGTQYEILLGLLGNQLTAQRKAAGEGAFNRFDNMNYPGGAYFAETGHNLRNSFKTYWEANGGLAIYGFPISEEFTEVNPDDGQTYVVQYFERNRFEWHPENKGTKYEVLLGLLGNTLLKQKGWL